MFSWIYLIIFFKKVIPSNALSNIHDTILQITNYRIMAKWQSGNAAACKAVNAGSIPTLAFIGGAYVLIHRFIKIEFLRVHYV